MARIRIKEGGVVVHSETETFDREPAARLWIKTREAELAQPGALAKLKAPDPTFAETIQKYVAEYRKGIGKTKAQVLNAVAATSLAKRRGSIITSADWGAVRQRPQRAPANGRQLPVAHLGGLPAGSARLGPSA